VIVSGGFIVAAPFFWYPPYPYPYPGYAYESPAYGGPGYSTATTPTYIEQSDIHYYWPRLSGLLPETSDLSVAVDAGPPRSAGHH